jgi:hypothetical protein
MGKLGRGGRRKNVDLKAAQPPFESIVVPPKIGKKIKWKMEEDE